MATRTTIEARFLDSAHARDGELVARLTSLVNDVYEVAEEGLWQPGSKRTNAEEMTGLIADGEIAVAMADGHMAGAVRVQKLSDESGEFGMLAADPDLRGIGIGRDLVAFAERHVRDRGMGAMQLELLVPRHWKHPNKVFLDEWYRRIGYRVIRTDTLDGTYPELAPLLATECEFVIYEKPLG
jgi:GNAT superfamily N-acetyltransferase